MKLSLTFKKINYDGLTETILPMLRENAKNSDIIPKKVSAILSFPGNLPTKMLRALSDDTKEKLLFGILNRYGDKLCASASDALSARGIVMVLDKVQIYKNADDTVLCLDVHDINYEKLFTSLLPVIRGKTKDKDNTASNLISAVMSIEGDVPMTVIRALSERQKDELVSLLINTFEPSVCTLIEKLASENGIDTVISGINAESDS